LTKWHPAFLSLGKTLDECAKNYRGFCRKYKPRHKPEKRSRWGSKFLPKVKKKKKNKVSPGQMRLPWADWEPPSNLVAEVARQFVLANCYDPEIAMQFFDDQ
ncbi:MAG: transposase, partial [Trichodesmium sp. St2_bin2_1]|nr:transposase [Trichodesmium sp. St2_bin2_1]